MDEITDYTDFQSGLTGTSRWLKRSYGYDKLNRTVSIEYTDNMSSGNDIREAHYYKYDADNRLSEATGRTGETVDYEQDNKYNGFGQRVRKKEGSDETNYFYDGTAVLYTEDGNGETTTFNLIGTEDNILFTARPAEEEETSFYSYTRDLRESTINLVGSDGSSVRSYSYDDFGETKVMGSGDFCNEVCYGAGIYDDTTGLYYLNARYYDPDTGNFLTQDTYRGSRSRTETLNLYGYCAGNPINYTDPSGHCLFARRA